ncbi:MAG: hypothetical protein QGH24_02615 [Candidatus Marinimicrobia bacterium]|nr:hypothetical protein [Candidatus Neomarinimicrobiota bacterium]
MKILYISPENTVGTLSAWKSIHENNGHYCRTLTFFRSPKNFNEDICLDLPFNFTKNWMACLRHIVYKIYRGKDGYRKEKSGYPPVWKPEGIIDTSFLRFKDWVWYPRVESAIREYDLLNFDVIHFESGMDFLKNEFFVKKIKEARKKIICHYHGEDLRTRGVMPELDSISDLNLTNELDLLEKHPNIHYIFLPFDTKSFTPKKNINEKIRVAHAPTNRYYKGSNLIINLCRKLEDEGMIHFDLIENLPHQKAIKYKKEADIFIDQIGDKGGWGYGMNSVEALSMGICTLTEMNKKYCDFLPDHPFVNVNEKTLEIELRRLINDRNRILHFGRKGKDWVDKTHNYTEVANSLYTYYRNIGLSV